MATRLRKGSRAEAQKLRPSNGLRKSARSRAHDERIAAVDDTINIHIGTEVSRIRYLTGTIARLLAAIRRGRSLDAFSPRCLRCRRINGDEQRFAS